MPPNNYNSLPISFLSQGWKYWVGLHPTVKPLQVFFRTPEALHACETHSHFGLHVHWGVKRQVTLLTVQLSAKMRPQPAAEAVTLRQPDYFLKQEQLLVKDNTELEPRWWSTENTLTTFLMCTHHFLLQSFNYWKLKSTYVAKTQTPTVPGLDLLFLKYVVWVCFTVALSLSPLISILGYMSKPNLLTFLGTVLLALKLQLQHQRLENVFSVRVGRMKRWFPT